MKDPQPGQRVHIYAESHYNQRGTIREVREMDAMGRVTVELDGSGQRHPFHAGDLEEVQP